MVYTKGLLLNGKGLIFNLNQKTKGNKMKDWNKEFVKILETLENKAGSRGQDNPEAYDALIQIQDWIWGDHDLLITFADDDEAYDRREYTVVMSEIESNDLCGKPFFKDIYGI